MATGKNPETILIMLFNYHTHSHFCDGKQAPQQYIEQAIALSFSQLGFSSHAPVPFENPWSIRPGQLPSYCKEIQQLKKEYVDNIEILLALEADYIPGITESFSFLKSNYHLDYIIGSVHLVVNPGQEDLWFIDGPEENFDKGLKDIFQNDIQQAVNCFWSQTEAMILTQKPDIIGHLDKIKMNNRNRFFSSNEQWYIKRYEQTLNIIALTGCIVEVNTRGLYTGKCEELFPSEEILLGCLQRNIPVTISSDAHEPSQLNYEMQLAAKILQNIGYKEVMKFDKGCFIPYSLNKYIENI